MKSTVSVTRERLIPATPAAVWHVVATPEMHERLDPRCRLESTTGDGVGSEYVLNVQAGRAQARLHYVVVAAIPERRWTAEVELGGEDAGVQHAEFLPEAEGTLLRWTVTRPASRWTRFLAIALCRYELDEWLAAIDRHSRSTPSGTAAV